MDSIIIVTEGSISLSKKIIVINIMPLMCKIHSKKPELIIYIRGYGKIIDTDIDIFTNYFSKYLHEPTPFKMLVDLRNVKKTPFETIKTLTTKMNFFEKLAVDKLIATCILLNDGPLKTMVKLLFKFCDQSTPTFVTSDLTSGCDFLNSY